MECIAMNGKKDIILAKSTLSIFTNKVFCNTHPYMNRIYEYFLFDYFTFSALDLCPSLIITMLSLHVTFLLDSFAKSS